jgi:hypothetical protein
VEPCQGHMLVERSPLTDPQVGDVVQSSHFPVDGTQVGRRLVTKRTLCNVEYITGTGKKTVTRNCLPYTWKKWCRENRAYVVTEQKRDY